MAESDFYTFDKASARHYSTCRCCCCLASAAPSACIMPYLLGSLAAVGLSRWLGIRLKAIFGGFKALNLMSYGRGLFFKGKTAR